jgi:hypothetical protein
MTAGASGGAIRPALADLVMAVPFVISMQFADLIGALAFVLAFDLRVVASIRASSERDDR